MIDLDSEFVVGWYYNNATKVVPNNDPTETGEFTMTIHSSGNTIDWVDESKSLMLTAVATVLSFFALATVV